MVALSVVMILLSLLLLGQSSGQLITKAFAKEPSEAESASFYDFSKLYAEIFQDIKNRYVDEVDEQKVFQASIHGMFNSLDPYSSYLDPDNFNQLEKDTEGSFSGVGIHISIRPDVTGREVLTVISPMAGSPAGLAGVLPWDRIIEIDGESTAGIDIMEAVRKLTGPEGTKVVVGIMRDGQDSTLYFTITREKIKIDSVFWKMEDDGILVARLDRFSENTTRDLRNALEAGMEQDARALILDLRYNTGGLLKEAIAVSDLFLEAGDVVVSTKGRQKNQNMEYEAENAALVDWPILIMINQATASASEIVAGALRDHGRAKLIGPEGKRTYGKGSVQTIDPLEHSLQRDEDGNFMPSALRITTARYYTPNGTAIDTTDPDKRGLPPDLEVPLTPEQQAWVYSNGLLLGHVDLTEPEEDESEPAEDNSEDDEAVVTPEDKETAAVLREKLSRAGGSVELAADDVTRILGLLKKIESGKQAENGETLVDIQLDFTLKEMRKILSGESQLADETRHAAKAPQAELVETR